MDEQETKETEQPVKDNGTGDKPTELTLIEQANAAAKRVEDANSKTEELLKRQEAETARRMLGGRAEAGVQPEPVTKMTDKEYAEAMEKGKVNPLKEDGFI